MSNKKNIYSKFENNSEFKLWFEIAKQGDAEAEYMLGMLFYRAGEQSDGIEAIKWFWKSAKQGYADAQYMLGLISANGFHVRPDMKEALKWFHAAAEQGHVEAQFEIGLRYAYSGHVKQNLPEAAKWFQQAAEHGHKDAQFELADCTCSGTEWRRTLKRPSSTSAKRRIRDTRQLNLILAGAITRAVVLRKT